MHATQKASPARRCGQQEDQLPSAGSIALAKHGHCIQPDLGQGTTLYQAISTEGVPDYQTHNGKVLL